MGQRRSGQDDFKTDLIFKERFVKKDILLSGNEIGWRQAWKSKEFRLQLICVLSVIFAMAFAAPFFFDFIESREGVIIGDPILDLFPSRNVSWLVFFILYSGVVLGLYSNLLKPVCLLQAFETYAMVMLMRIVTLTFLALEPPHGYIPLREPVVQMFFTSDGRIISKDLFFSGHMSTLLSLVFTVGKTIVRRVLILFSVILAVLLLIQRVHYTIDLLAAPVGTFLSWLMAKKIMSRISFE